MSRSVFQNSSPHPYRFPCEEDEYLPLIFEPGNLNPKPLPIGLAAASPPLPPDADNTIPLVAAPISSPPSSSSSSGQMKTGGGSSSISVSDGETWGVSQASQLTKPPPLPPSLQPLSVA
jgi:hypothetical protein